MYTYREILNWDSKKLNRVRFYCVQKVQKSLFPLAQRIDIGGITKGFQLRNFIRRQCDLRSFRGGFHLFYLRHTDDR